MERILTFALWTTLSNIKLLLLGDQWAGGGRELLLFKDTCLQTFAFVLPSMCLFTLHSVTSPSTNMVRLWLTCFATAWSICTVNVLWTPGFLYNSGAALCRCPEETSSKVCN